LQDLFITGLPYDTSAEQKQQSAFSPKTTKSQEPVPSEDILAPEHTVRIVKNEIISGFRDQGGEAG